MNLFIFLFPTSPQIKLLFAACLMQVMHCMCEIAYFSVYGNLSISARSLSLYIPRCHWRQAGRQTSSESDRLQTVQRFRGQFTHSRELSSDYRGFLYTKPLQTIHLLFISQSGVPAHAPQWSILQTFSKSDNTILSVSKFKDLELFQSAECISWTNIKTYTEIWKQYIFIHMITVT